MLTWSELYSHFQVSKLHVAAVPQRHRISQSSPALGAGLHVPSTKLSQHSFAPQLLSPNSHPSTTARATRHETNSTTVNERILVLKRGLEIFSVEIEA